MSAQDQKQESLFHFVSSCLAIGILALSMFLVSIHFDHTKPQVQVLGAQIDLEQERKFWLKILDVSPTYRDGWLELANLEKEIGNTELAQKYINTANQIDPNFVIEK